MHWGWRGFGPAHLRPDDLIARDVDQGYLSPEQARAQYGFVAPAA